jgi:hypothetical protein
MSDVSHCYFSTKLLDETRVPRMMLADDEIEDGSPRNLAQLHPIHFMLHY